MATETKARPELPPLPERMKRLKLDHRGYPVPWFVPWLDENKERTAPGHGVAEFRMMDEKTLMEAIRYQLCWICGERMGRHKAFVIGPMCMVNGINAEPPSHVECADFAARACPFLTRPHARRRENDLPEGGTVAGIGIRRNPGVACVWRIEGGFAIKPDPTGKPLFALPAPSEVRFYAEGRLATRAEVAESVLTGLPLLLEVCVTEGEREEVRARAKATEPLWPL